MAQLATLAKRIGPVDQSPIMSSGAAGVYVHPRVDEVLLYLTGYGDEREYETMWRLDAAISGAGQQRISGVVEAGSEVLLGKSGRASAKRLRDFAISFLRRIPAFGTLQTEMLMAIYWGWRPVELQWGDIRHKARSYRGVVRAVARMPWHYEVTIDGQVVRLEFGPDGGVQPPGRFIVCTAGGTESPYGVAWLRRLWALYHLSSNFDKLSAKAFSRALGIMKATPPTGLSAGDAADQVTQIFAKLNSYNVLVESDGWTFGEIEFASLPESLEGLLRFLDERKRIALVGQNLTTEVRGGSFAAAKVHGDILGTYLRADARQLQSWMNDQLLDLALRMNFGEIDPDDAPRWQSRLFSSPNHEAVKLYHDLGGALDGRRLADTLGVPAALPENDEEVVLRKQGPALAPAPWNTEPSRPPERQEPEQPPRARSLAAPADLGLVPAELRALPQWVVWRYELRGDRLAKIHYAPDGVTEASSSDPSTWGTYAAALSAARGFEGLAFTFAAEDPYCGVDLDDCLGDAGGISTVAGSIIARLATYTEISPSGRGVKLWCRGKLPPGRRRKVGVEMYDAGRFFAVTGRHLTGTPLTIEDRQAEIEAIHAETFGAS